MKIKIQTECQPATAGGAIEWLAESAAVAVQSALDEVNGTATSFTVRYANDVYNVALRAERHLKDHAVAESERAGATVTFRPRGPYAGAYEYSGISTTVTLTRSGNGFWYLTDVKRTKVYPRAAERFLVTISDRAAARLIKRTLKAFGREKQIYQQPIAA
jgi:hypothetical protein